MENAFVHLLIHLIRIFFLLLGYQQNIEFCWTAKFAEESLQSGNY